MYHQTSGGLLFSMIRLALAALTLLLAGCASSAAAPAPSTSASRPSMDAAYLSLARQAVPNVTDRGLLKFAHAICGDLRAGGTWVAEVAQAVHGLHLSGYHAGELIGAAVVAYCPDQESKTP